MDHKVRGRENVDWIKAIKTKLYENVKKSKWY